MLNRRHSVGNFPRGDPESHEGEMEDEEDSPNSSNHDLSANLHVHQVSSHPHEIALKQAMAMISSMSTAYNIVNVSLVLPILGQLVFEESQKNNDFQPFTNGSAAKEESMVASVVLLAMMVGQIGGGYLGDVLGPLQALRLVMIFQVVGSTLSSLAAWNEHIYTQIAISRFLLGIGCGGVYPLAAVILRKQHSSVEDSDKSMHKIVWAFSMQGVGLLLVPLLAVPLLHTVSMRYVWRILLGVGAIPGLILLGLSACLNHHHHSPHRHALAQEDRLDLSEIEEEIDGDRLPLSSTMSQRSDGPEEVTILDSVGASGGDDASLLSDTGSNNRDGLMRTLSSSTESFDENLHNRYSLMDEPDLVRKLLATAATWFLFDVLFYGNTLFQPIVLQSALGKPDNSNSPLEIIQKTAQNSLILTVIELPGFAVAATVLGKTYCGAAQTPQYVMLQGFACMAFLYFLIGTFWHRMRESPVILVTLYGLTFFFSNYGPNTVTFFIPALIFSPHHRSTWNGIAAASGKLGAVIGASFFAPLAASFGPSVVMLVCSVIALISTVITKLFVPRDIVRQSD